MDMTEPVIVPQKEGAYLNVNVFNVSVNFCINAAWSNSVTVPGV